MAQFDLSTPKGRFDFSTNKTLEFAFQQAIIEIASESIADGGDGSSFPYSGNVASEKIMPFLRSVFRGGVNLNRQVLSAFIALLPEVVVDENQLSTTLYNTLKVKTKIWIEYRQEVSTLDKTTLIENVLP